MYSDLPENWLDNNSSFIYTGNQFSLKKQKGISTKKCL